MTEIAVIALSVAVLATLAAVALLIGLCRAAADTRDIEPDNGEYESYD